MKTIFKIARLELKTLFSSPIAWLLLIIFLVQNSLEFVELMKRVIVDQTGLGFGTTFPVDSVTERVFGVDPYLGHRGILPGLIGRWYLYIPLLTMGLVSRELGSGNIKLLFSSPIKIREIAWGKFVGIMMYWTIVMGVLVLLTIFGYLFITDFDLPMVLVSMLGVYLVAMLYSAVGLFVSCLTTYPIVAAISTFLVLGALDYFGGMWQGVPFLRDLTWFINTGAHTENLLRGLLVSKDLVYFLSLTIMFVMLSGMVLDNKVHFRPTAVKIGRYLLLCIVVLLIGYVVSRPQYTLYYDATAQKSNTLTSAGQEVMKRMKGKVEVTIFENLFFDKKHYGHADHVNSNKDEWEPYKRFLPGLEIKVINYYDTVKNYSDEGDGYPGYPEISIDSAARIEAAKLNVDLKNYLPPAQIRKLVNLNPYDNKHAVRIKNNGKEVFLRGTPGTTSWRVTEEFFIANFKRMLDGPDTLAFLSGNGERSIENEGDRDYRYMMYSHLEEETSSLDQNGLEAFSHDPAQPVPTHIAALVIADPVNEYSTEALKNIQDYIAKGGNLLIAKGSSDPAILEKITLPMGVKFKPGYMVQPNDEGSAEHVRFNFIHSALQDTFTLNRKTVKLSDASVMEYEQGKDGFKVSPVLLSDPKTSWNKAKESDLDTGGLAFHPELGDERKAFPAALALTRNVKGKEQRIMIIGSADFLGRRGIFNGLFFHQTVFRWFTYGKFPLTSLRKPPIGNRVTLSYKQTDLLKYFLVLLLPALLIIAGSIYLTKRRNL